MNSEKRQMASQTNLTLQQVNDWFINARRRHLKPALDGAVGASIADLPQAFNLLELSEDQVLVQEEQQPQQEKQQMQQSNDEPEAEAASEEGDTASNNRQWPAALEDVYNTTDDLEGAEEDGWECTDSWKLRVDEVLDSEINDESIKVPVQSNKTKLPDSQGDVELGETEMSKIVEQIGFAAAKSSRTTGL